jgi:hypothetical protein
MSRGNIVNGYTVLLVVVAVAVVVAGIRTRTLVNIHLGLFRRKSYFILR